MTQGFEVEMYLKAIQCDVHQKKSLSSLRIATNILWPEVKKMCELCYYNYSTIHEYSCMHIAQGLSFAGNDSHDK